MGASKSEIYRHIKNIVKRKSYGANGAKHYKIQKERFKIMAKGGTGELPSETDTMVSTEGHTGTVRELHFDDWDDKDFRAVLRALNKFDKTDVMPPPPKIDDDSVDVTSTVQIVVQRAMVLFDALDRDDQIDALNALAVRLGVMDPDDV